MAHDMSPDERRAFLMEGTRTAKVAVTRADGRPHVTPVWFVLDGDDVVFNTDTTSLKGRCLLRDPRVSLCVEDDTPPFAFVLVEGVAEVSDDLEAMVPWSTAIGGRYMGADRAEQYGRRNAVEGELLVRVRPTRIVAKGGVAE
jgi:PPOX class probable F420-dependent enzyme